MNAKVKIITDHAAYLIRMLDTAKTVDTNNVRIWCFTGNENDAFFRAIEGGPQDNEEILDNDIRQREV